MLPNSRFSKKILQAAQIGYVDQQEKDLSLKRYYSVRIGQTALKFNIALLMLPYLKMF